jgi:hypothetical protein
MLLPLTHLVASQLFLLDPPAGSLAQRAAIQTITADGTTVGGQLGFPSGRTTGMNATRVGNTMVVVDLGDMEGGLEYTTVEALSDDGTAFGTAFTANVVDPGDEDGVQVAFRFADAFEILPDLTGAEGTNNLTDVTADGLIAVGASYPQPNGDFLAFVSVGGPGGMARALPRRPMATRGDARAISDDGTIIVCADDLGSDGLAPGYTVRRNGDTFTLGTTLAFSPADISGDGTVVVGALQRGEDVLAVRVHLDAPLVIEELGELPGGVVSSEALAVNEDGTVVVGRSASGVEGDDPYFEEATYIRDGVTQRLADVATERGVDLSALAGGLLSQATAVSADGLVVAGNAWVGPPALGVVKGFVVVLPPPNVPQPAADGGTSEDAGTSNGAGSGNDGDNNSDKNGGVAPGCGGCSETPTPVLAGGLLLALFRSRRRTSSRGR